MKGKVISNKLVFIFLTSFFVTLFVCSPVLENPGATIMIEIKIMNNQVLKKLFIILSYLQATPGFVILNPRFYRLPCRQ